jgi:SAM-dependent methyltransferase
MNINQHFEKLTNTYLSARSGDQNFKIYKSLLWEYFFKYNRIYLTNESRVLEAMCGAGDALGILLDNNIPVSTYHAFDYSITMAEAARCSISNVATRHNHTLLSKGIFVADVLKYNVTYQYDLIIVLGGLHHVYHDVGRALTRLVDVLRPGGLFLNFEPTHNNIVMRIIRSQIYKRNSFFDTDTESGFDFEQYNKQMSDSGLILLGQVYSGLALYCLLYNPDAFWPFPPIPKTLLKIIFEMESRLYHTSVAKKLSFGTMSLWQKYCK